MTAAHERFMYAALDQARAAMVKDEVPIGAVVVVAGSIVGSGFNQSRLTADPTAHAEIVALRQAGLTMCNYRLSSATLYVTVEPCLMCAGALVHARINTLVYGTVEPKAGAVVSTTRVLDGPALNHRVRSIGGILENESRALIQEFFKGRRNNEVSD